MYNFKLAVMFPIKTRNLNRTRGYMLRHRDLPTGGQLDLGWNQFRASRFTAEVHYNLSAGQPVGPAQDLSPSRTSSAVSPSDLLASSDFHFVNNSNEIEFQLQLWRGDQLYCRTHKPISSLNCGITLALSLVFQPNSIAERHFNDPEFAGRTPGHS